MLGPTRVFIGGRLVDSPLARRARVRQLLALLAAEPDLRRERAMALLWPDLDQAAASRNLRVTLTYLRQVLASPRMLLVDSSAIRLVAVPGLDVDLWQLDAQLAAAARARDAGDQAGHAAALAAAAALWHGEPLVDLADLEELTGTVTRVRTALTDAVLLLGEVRLSDGLAAESVRCAQTVLAEDPYNERAHRLAVATQLHLGDHQAARDAAARMTAALGRGRRRPVGDLPDPAPPDRRIRRPRLAPANGRRRLRGRAWCSRPREPVARPADLGTGYRCPAAARRRTSWRQDERPCAWPCFWSGHSTEDLMTIGQDKLMQTGACSETLRIPLRRMAATGARR